MTYYKCKGDENCGGCKPLNGQFICHSAKEQIDYAGHIFCANIDGQVEIDEEQTTIDFDVKGEENDGTIYQDS